MSKQLHINGPVPIEKPGFRDVNVGVPGAKSRGPKKVTVFDGRRGVSYSYKTKGSLSGDGDQYGPGVSDERLASQRRAASRKGILSGLNMVPKLGSVGRIYMVGTAAPHTITRKWK